MKLTPGPKDYSTQGIKLTPYKSRDIFIIVHLQYMFEKKSNKRKNPKNQQILL